jgi:hypothetical protein
MPRQQSCLAIGCTNSFPAERGRGGRPRKFCSDRCRSRWRRWQERRARKLAAPVERWEDTTDVRHEVQAAAYQVAGQARKFAAELVEESDTPPDPYGLYASPRAPAPRREVPAGYTRAALDVAAAVEDLVAAAVAADRVAGHSWEQIGQVLGVSADTAARRYRPSPPPGSP